MKLLALAAALGAALVTPAFAGGKTYHYKCPTGQVIVVSCYRGPYKKVIWDKANPSFISSLMTVGYDRASAEAIGTRVCRDQSLVGNPHGIRAVMTQIYQQSPSYYQLPPGYDRHAGHKHGY
jgi:hypothetical protein